MAASKARGKPPGLNLVGPSGLVLVTAPNKFLTTGLGWIWKKLLRALAGVSL